MDVATKREQKTVHSHFIFVSSAAYWDNSGTADNKEDWISDNQKEGGGVPWANREVVDDTKFACSC